MSQAATAPPSAVYADRLAALSGVVERYITAFALWFIDRGDRPHHGLEAARRALRADIDRHVHDLRTLLAHHLLREHTVAAEADVDDAEKVLVGLAEFLADDLPDRLERRQPGLGVRHAYEATAAAKAAVDRLGRWAAYLEGRGRNTDSPPRKIPSAAPRLRVAISGKSVLLDGEPVPFDGTAEGNETARIFIRYLVAAGGDWVSSGDINAKEQGRTGGISGQRWDRVRAALPDRLRSLTESNRRKGYRLARSAWRRSV